MSTPIKLNFKIIQGSTFDQVLRWESGIKAYKTITSVSQAAPVTVFSVGHGLPLGWRTRVTNVVGMKEINCSTDQYYVVTAKTDDSVTFNAVNSLGYTSYVSGGVLEYNEPVNLTGFTARLQIRAKLDDATVIKELTTENSGIVIDNTAKTIRLYINATDTASLNFTSAVYSLELVSGGGEVTQLVNGNFTLVKEVTR